LPPTAILDEDATIAMMSRCKGDGGVDVYVAVKLNALGQRLGRHQRLLETFPGFVLHVFSRGPILVRIARQQRRELAMEAAEQGVSMNRLISQKLGRSG